MLSIEDRPIESVKPYENNPRVNEHAVDAVPSTGTSGSTKAKT